MTIPFSINIRRTAVFGSILMIAIFSSADKDDGPARGTWEFEPEKVWEVTELGGIEFGRPAEPRVSSDGTLYFHDFDTKKSYMIDRDGEFAGSFAGEGSSPGQVDRYINCFLSPGMVVIGAPDKLHLFDMKGVFIKSVPNDLFARFPFSFIDDDTALMGPGGLCNLPDGEALVMRVEIESGEETEIFRFKLAEEDNVKFGGVIVGLIPQINMDYDEDSGLVFFGRNDRYEITAADRNGVVKRTFGLQRERVAVDEGSKRAHFEGHGIPAERYEEILPLLPGKLTCFHRLQVIGNHVYVFRMDELTDRRNRQEIDIFSRDGEYLYAGSIVLPEGDYFQNPDQLQIGGGHLYAILKDDTGRSRIAKYRIRIPA